MLAHIKFFFIALLIFMVTDLIWFRLISGNFYMQHYAPWVHLVDGKFQPIWWATIMIYIIFSISLLVFVIPLANNGLLPACLYGALFGATVYGVYNLTCIAVFKDFPAATSLVDISWGGFLYGWTAFIVQWLKLH